MRLPAKKMQKRRQAMSENLAETCRQSRRDKFQNPDAMNGWHMEWNKNNTAELEHDLSGSGGRG